MPDFFVSYLYQGLKLKKNKCKKL